MLLKMGASVGARTGRGNYWMALHAAVYQERASVVKLLLEHGADAVAVDSGGANPSWPAAALKP